MEDRYEDLRVCRVCGLEYPVPPWGPELVSEFCDCCGVQCSYGDAAPDAARHHREQWLASGAEWFHPEGRPRDWNLERQLTQLPEVFR